ncbi:uncharacterized protein LOC108667203 [Hyalella azteca]|uniref:Uncharacterized protein LOC108667203 n=1 Tax=Hyalella azteca TaxID=294128 RepID=A0A8B7N725_HYAAZ|nr:uncharacterized protein LOC108667203 [Hyalella azteca]
MHRAFILLAVVHLLSGVCSDDAGRQGSSPTVEDMPIELESYGPRARLFLGTSTNTRVVTFTSSTVVQCVSVFSAQACAGRKKRRDIGAVVQREIDPILTLRDAPDLASSQSTRDADDGKNSGRILFYAATIFTTLTYTTFADIGRTATVSLACTVAGNTITFCG